MQNKLAQPRKVQDEGCNSRLQFKKDEEELEKAVESNVDDAKDKLVEVKDKTVEAAKTAKDKTVEAAKNATNAVG